MDSVMGKENADTTLMPGSRGIGDKDRSVLAEVGRQVSALRAQLSPLTAQYTAILTRQQEMEDRMEHYEDTQRLTRSQCSSVQRAIYRRCAELLGIEHDDFGRVSRNCLERDIAYRGGFIQALYRDCKRDGCMAQPYSETYRKDYQTVMQYIAEWVPSEGVTGLKSYIDARRAARRKLMLGA